MTEALYRKYGIWAVLIWLSICLLDLFLQERVGSGSVILAALIFAGVLNYYENTTPRHDREKYFMWNALYSYAVVTIIAGVFGVMLGHIAELSILQREYKAIAFLAILCLVTILMFHQQSRTFSSEFAPKLEISAESIQRIHRQSAFMIVFVLLLFGIVSGVVKKQAEPIPQPEETSFIP